MERNTIFEFQEHGMLRTYQPFFSDDCVRPLCRPPLIRVLFLPVKKCAPLFGDTKGGS